MQSTRLIMYHKQFTSARTRFLMLDHDGVCAFDSLPPLAQVLERKEMPPEKVAQHPATLISQAEQALGLSRGGLELETGFRVRVDVPGGTIGVFLARFTAIDPPFALASCFRFAPGLSDSLPVALGMIVGHATKRCRTASKIYLKTV